MDRYDCDRRKSTDAYPAKDRPIRDFSLPDLTGLTRYAPPSTHTLIISAPIIIGEKIRTGFMKTMKTVVVDREMAFPFDTDNVKIK